MKRETIPITTEEAWLEQRAKDITSTEISALFGLSPYLTEFELFHRKRAGEQVRIEENERMRWGKRLESAIAHGVSTDEGWTVAHADFYARIPEVRLGSSFDYEVTSAEWTDLAGRYIPGLLEIKNVDSLQFNQKWIDDGVTLEAPEHIELQIQHQMEVHDTHYCVLVAMIGGNRIRWVRRKRDRDVGKTIRDRIAEFWDSVTHNREPSPDYSMDADFIIKQLRASANEGEVMTADPELTELIAQYQFVSREAANMADLKEQTKAQLLTRIGDAAKVVSDLGTISCGMVKASTGTLITPEMVGTYVGARAGYRNFRFTPKKGN